MAGELILIIEDNEKNQKLVRDVLQVKGYQTLETETAEEGHKLALESHPALILMDIQMDIQLPGIDGITALKQLRADPVTKTIPVIAITASAMTYNRQAMLAEGFDGYQNKPISVKDFLEEVRRVLDSDQG
jgi:two-component system, cell cycle response regulator DivK